MFVTYSGLDEVIVTTKANEKEALKQYFTKGGRTLEEYDRDIHNEDVAVLVTARVKI